MPSTEPTWVMLDCSVALAMPKSASLTSPSLRAQQVARLDVAVDDPVAVGVVQALAGLFDDRDGLVDLQPAIVTQDLRAGLPLDVLHHDEVLPRLLVQARVEDLHDVRVYQTRGGLGLALEARDERRILGEVLGQQLDRHTPFQAHIEREVHRRHPPEPEPALQTVAPGDLSPWLIDRSRSRSRCLPQPPPPALPPASPPGTASGRLGRAFTPGAAVPPPLLGVVGVVWSASWGWWVSSVVGLVSWWWTSGS